MYYILISLHYPTIKRIMITSEKFHATIKFVLVFKREIILLFVLNLFLIEIFWSQNGGLFTFIINIFFIGGLPRSQSTRALFFTFISGLVLYGVWLKNINCIYSDSQSIIMLIVLLHFVFYAVAREGKNETV